MDLHVHTVNGELNLIVNISMVIAWVLGLLWKLLS